jgi:hypothetical protein
VGRQPHGWMAGVGVVARGVHDGASSAEGGAWPSRLGQAVLGQRRVGFGLVVVVGGGWAVGQVGRVADREGRDAARIAVGRQLAVTTLRGHGAARTESPGASGSPRGWVVA